MKNTFLFLLLISLFTNCSDEKKLLNDRLSYAQKQTSLLMTQALEQQAIPRTIANGQIKWIDNNKFDWTEGFFPGTLWLLYQYSHDDSFKQGAESLQAIFAQYTNASSHDLGFVFNCSFGKGYELTKDSTMLSVMKEAGETLIGRFNPQVGAIKSWDVNRGWQATRGWQYPVIIDNMMNLEFLFNLSQLTGDKKYASVAIAHANTTMKNHFRADFSSYHVVDYDSITGEVLHRHTAQGYAHESSWARGQAWGLYGYVTCYRFTKDTTYLSMAEHIADYIMHSPKIPSDKVPYWDYDAPEIPNAPRDASAAAVTASALIELDHYVPGKYLSYAKDILDALSSDTYRAKIGENHDFILMHSVGSIPHNNEIDVPLNYADYYYVEALMRLWLNELAYSFN